MPYLEILSDFRDKVRIQARTCKATSILQECDILRDDTLPNVGVRLEDEEGSKSKVKLVNKEELLKEKEMKKRLEAEKVAEKIRKKLEAEAAAAAKESQKKISPLEMFKLESNKYSKFSENVSINFLFACC